MSLGILHALRLGQVLAVAMVVPLLAGCSGLADGTDSFTGLGQVSEERSTFNDARIIRMQPTWVYGGSGLVGAAPVKVGAYWTSEKPEQVALVLKVDGDTNYSGTAYQNLYGLDVNVGGDIHSFKAAPATSFDSSRYNTVTKTIYTSSTNVVIIPLPLLEAMVTAPHCRLRFDTSRGPQEADFSLERSTAGGAGARLHMRTFIERVQAQRAQSQA